MENGQTIRCKHCGAEFVMMTTFGLMKGINRAIGFRHVETEMAIRCPQCMKRLNNTQEEFEEMVVGQLCWD